jgi:ribose transport system ATP-binding protein
MKNVTKIYPGVIALDNVHFDLNRGEVHALIGENGAGKSTLIKAIAGAHGLDKGDIFLEGVKVDIKNPHHANQLGIYTIYQELTIVPDMSIAENMFLGKEVIKGGLISHRTQIERADKLFRSFNYRLDPRRTVRDLNTAELRMMSIIKALDSDVKILILDEPTASLTDREKDILFEHVRDLRAKGAGIIYISHRLEELQEIADRATVFRNGQYIDTLKMDDVKSIDDLVPLMIGKEVENKFPKVKAEIGEPLLKVEKLALKNHFSDVDLEVKAGEVLGFFGLVGCGFEEVFRSVFGASTYDSGSIKVADGSNFKSFKKNDPRAALDNKISYIPRDRKHEGLVMTMSVRENVVIASYRQFTRTFLRFINFRKAKAVASKYKDIMNIKTPNLSVLVETLSGGNQQKVVLAKALCRGGQIFIFCEPTAGIDVGSKVEVYQFMNQLTQNGSAVVMVSYELPEVMGMSDRIMVMYNGKIVQEFKRENATEEEILKYAFGHGEEQAVA